MRGAARRSCLMPACSLAWEGKIIFWVVRWSCRYGIHYRQRETMLAERGVPLDHATLYHWAQRYAPEIEKRLRGVCCHPGGLSRRPSK